MEIRTVSGADMPDLSDLWKEFMDFHADRNPFYRRATDGHEVFMKWLRKESDQDDFLVLVAEEQGHLIGYCIALVKENPPVFELRRYGFVQDMAVTAEWRRRGVARALFEAACEWFLDQGVGHIQLNVAASNATSQGYWRKMGFGPHVETWTREL